MTKRLSDLVEDKDRINIKEDSFFFKQEEKNPFSLNGKKRVNLLALGDVGSTVLMGLRLMGENQVESIGIWDINPKVCARFEMEINQIDQPIEHGSLPKVEIISTEELFNCHMMIFCASRGVPPVGQEGEDVRMAQLKSNVELVEYYAAMAKKEDFKGIFAIVSDPVDPLCKAAYLQGLAPQQVEGYGLGVMNSRALYFARKEDKFGSFLAEGRAFGPHGEDLVIANSIEEYDHKLSLELTKLAIESNLKTRQLGFKPYIAPALSSGAISLLATLSGEWHYSSTYMGKDDIGAFLGVKNRRTPHGIEVEDLPLPEKLFNRIKGAYDNLAKII
ncbi:MAG: lactate dehydrogenase [Anaerovoracaceae bacterium]